MGDFIPIKRTKAQIAATPIIEGQLLISTDTDEPEISVDVNNLTRKTLEIGNSAALKELRNMVDSLEKSKWGVGDIRTLSYRLPEAPEGDYLLCDGREIDLNDYPELKERWNYV